MKFIIIQFPIILVSIAYAFGIFISNYYSGNNMIVSFCSSFLLIISLLISERYLKQRDVFKTYSLLISITIISFFINSIRINNTNLSDNRTIDTEIKIIKTFNNNGSYQNCIIEDEANSKRYLGQITLVDTNNFKVGTKLFVDGDVSEIKSLIIPNNFDFGNYLKRRGVVGRIKIKHYVETTGRLSVSRKIEDKIDNSKLSKTSKGLMKALILGRKDDVSDKLIDSFSDSGIMHLLALSGLHIGILTLILTFLLKPLKIFRKGKLIRGITVVLLLWYYAYITGFSSSIVRATIMFSVIVFGHGLKREINIFNSLAVAALVLLIINPNYLFDVGFQLSFSAVIGIVWIFPMISNLWKPKSKFLRYFWSLLVVSIAAQLATFPFTLFYFHKFSGLFLLANIIEIPLITLLLGFSYLFVTLLLFGLEYNMLIYIYDKLVYAIQFVSLKISSVGSMIFDNIFINEFTVFALFFLLVVLILFIQHRKINYLYLTLLAVIFIQGIRIYGIKQNLNRSILMMAKDEVIIQKGYDYWSNLELGAKQFYNYTLSNKLNFKAKTNDDIFFFDNYFFRISNELSTNPIDKPHYLIIDKKVKNNPQLIVNGNTKGVIYSGYENSKYKNRWEYFCVKKGIPFSDTNICLFEKVE